MRFRISITFVAASCVCACSPCERKPPPPKPAQVAEAPAPKPPEPPPAPPVSADTLPPQKVVTADGISITETADGRVHLQTTAIWDEPIDSTYDNCEYYRHALPVLHRQVTKDRAALLDQACVEPKAATTKGKAVAVATKAGAGAPRPNVSASWPNGTAFPPR
jgi:hypothetical protein